MDRSKENTFKEELYQNPGSERAQSEKYRMWIFREMSWLSLTGLSGSGKSSLAFDTIYAEGQTAVYGIAVVLCTTVFRTDGEAECGEDRRTFSGDFD